MNSVRCIRCVVALVFAVLMFMYVNTLEEKQCKCSKNWKRDAVKYLSIVFIVLNVISIIMSLGVVDLSGKEPSLIMALLSVFYSVICFVYLALSIVYYIDITTHNDCACADDWKMHSLLYPIVVFGIVLLMSLYDIVVNWGDVSKLIKSRKSEMAKLLNKRKSNSKKTNKK